MGFKEKKPLYELGGFAKMSDENSTLLANPWANSNSTTGSAPFDQKFYLILNVAVGSRNGWFLYVLSLSLFLPSICYTPLLPLPSNMHIREKRNATKRIDWLIYTPLPTVTRSATSPGWTAQPTHSGRSGTLQTSGSLPGARATRAA